MGRSPCCDKVGLKKGPWTAEEDEKLLAYIQQHGHGSWRALPPKAGLRRCGKSCRLRWTNYLRPDIKRGEFSLQEQQTIIQLHALLGNRWSAIASHLPKRTDNEIKNYWNTHLKKRLTKMGLDPTTHKPKSHGLMTKDIANLSHMAQWETARLEAEARIVRESKINNINIIVNSNSNSNSSTTTTTTTTTTYHHHLPPRPPCLDILKVWQGTWLANKGKKDFSNIFNGYLESPTSILNFQVEKHHHHHHNNNNNNSNNPDQLKIMIHENTTLLEDVNYPESCTNIIGDGERLKGIMGNSSMQQVNDVSTNNCFSDFLEGYGDDIPTTDDNVIFMEEDINDHKINISYWNNILNSIDSTVF